MSGCAASPLNDVCCTEGFKMELTDARLCYAAAKEVKRLTGLSECAQYFFRCCLDRNRTDVYRNSTRGSKYEHQSKVPTSEPSLNEFT